MEIHAFERLKARYCVVALALAVYIQPGISYLLGDGYRFQWYWEDVIIYYYSSIVLAVFLGAAFYWTKPDLRALFGRPPRYDDLKSVLAMDVFLYLVAVALTTLLFIPVSFVLPDFVTWWLEWVTFPTVYITIDGRIPLLANVLSVLSLVIVVPVLEETIFRGYLLHRWSRKWGLWKAILLSSALFGAMHPDPLAAAVFGIGMSILYLRTQSLYVPMIAHGIYNLGVWLFDLYGVLDEGLDYYQYELAQFQGDWWFGAVCGVFAVLFADAYMRRAKRGVPLRLPAG